MQTLKKNKLFEGMTEQEISDLVVCLDGIRKTYDKKEFIFLAEHSAPKMSLLLSGRIQVIKENSMGDISIIERLDAGGLFAETFACMGLKTMPVSVIALEKSELLLMDIDRMLFPCEKACSFHQRLIANLVRIMAEKNAALNQRNAYLTHKTIRGRLEAYFFEQMEQSGSYMFTVPFNRNELAEYLCIDRSAMSREIGKMKQEGLLAYKKNRFQWKA